MTLSYAEELELIRLKRELEEQKHRNRLNELEFERGNIRIKRAAIMLQREVR